MLAVIENLRLFLETQRVGERMQVAMLVDEQALARALREKYRSQGEFADAHDQLLEDSIEKLFLVYLRLPPLSGPDVEELAQKYFGQMRALAATHASATNSPRTLPPAAVPTQPATPSTPSIAATTDPRTMPSTGMTKHTATIEVFTFTADEEQVLAAELQHLAIHRAGRLGPRTVRSFLFRYQLARLLLSSVGEKLEPAEVARCLASGHGPPTESEPGSELARRIVRQVSLR